MKNLNPQTEPENFQLIIRIIKIINWTVYSVFIYNNFLPAFVICKVTSNKLWNTQRQRSSEVQVRHMCTWVKVLGRVLTAR